MMNKLIVHAQKMSIASVILLSLIPIAVSISFDFPRFDPSSSAIQFQGDAVSSVGAIELINKVKYFCRAGLITYFQKVRLWDKTSNTVSDFRTHFSFSIDTLNQTNGTYGHGLTFFIAPAGFQLPANSDGGFLGLLNTTNIDSPANRIVFVEFDSFSNSEWDPPFGHVGINKNSMSSLVTLPWNASLHSEDTTDVWVVYNATAKNLSVFWSYRGEGDRRKNSTLSYNIDLKQVIPEWVSIGFSAATGKYIERHTLLSWAFSSNLESKVPYTTRAKVVKLAVGLSLLLGVVFVGGMLVLFVYRRRRRRIRKRLAEAASFDDELERGAGPRRFSYSELALATHNFSMERKLGEGGFGDVYKGYLIDLDIPVAVKKTSKGSKHGEKQYVTEVKVISRLRHRNLVQLLGWCHDQGQFLLVYEFMPNGSLDFHLFGRNNNNNKNPLPWAVRYKIALGLASGLLYLHEEWEQCVVHRDIKSSNIMLDSNFNVKLGDFGLARLMDHEHGAQTTGLAGTLGYMAPEYISTGKASKESDVYSFGVVALEIATGRRSMDPMVFGTQNNGLVEWVWNLYGRGDLLLGMDEKLEKDYFDTKQVECLMVVGLWCAHPDHHCRPSIRQAIQVLNFEATFPSLPARMPVASYQVPLQSASTASYPSFSTTTSFAEGR